MSGPKLFEVLQSWCNANKISVVLDASIGLGAEFNSEHPEALVLKVKSEQDEQVMLHEASHANFYFQKLSGQIDAKREAQLDNDIISVREAEPKLGQKEKDALARIFGSASGYSDPSLGPEPTDYSFIGNLVDESNAAKAIVSDRMGHPMTSFDEFCASVCTRAAYMDGDFDKFSQQMQEFRKAADELPALAPLYEKTCRVLAAAVEHGIGFANELRTLNGFRPEPPELMTMELNLAKMGRLLQDLARIELPAGRTGLETVSR